MTATLKLPRLRAVRARERDDLDAERGILSLHDRRRRPVRAGQIASHVFLLAGLVVSVVCYQLMLRIGALPQDERVIA